MSRTTKPRVPREDFYETLASHRRGPRAGERGQCEEGAGGVMTGDLDFYATPRSAILPILPHLPASDDVLDPCAGDGAILRVLASQGYPVRGIEVDEGHRGKHPYPVEYRDALGAESWGSPSLIAMNPPFTHAQAFVERALAEVRRGGTVAALLRLAFLESAKRVGFHREHPADVFVLASRPSFCISVSCALRCGWSVRLPVETPSEARPSRCPTCDAIVRTSSTDMAACAWFLWSVGRGGRWVVVGGDQ